MKNPLILDILSLLRQHPEGITEYLIIKSLETHSGFEHIDDDYQLAIFQKHFLVMNALYQLQKQLFDEEQLILDISALKIQLFSNSSKSNKKELSESDNAKLSEYYLDWSNLENTTRDDVNKLLDSFWKLYINSDKRREALSTLELEDNADNETINRRYRELAAIHHPDKGGDPTIFISIRQAYEVLNAMT